MKSKLFLLSISLILALSLFTVLGSPATVGAEPNSPDCHGWLEVTKTLIPSTDSGRFNLKIDRGSYHFQVSNVGDGGTTGRQYLSAETTYSVSETAGKDASSGLTTDLNQYTSTYACYYVLASGANGDLIKSGTGTSTTIYLPDTKSIRCTFTNSRKTTAVTFADAQAVAGFGDVTVNWQTAQEVDVNGFNVFRSDSVDGDRTMLNSALIPAQTPGGLSGASYQFIDTNIQTGNTYYYWIQTDELSGTSFYNDPLVVTAPYRVMIPVVLR